MPPIETSDRAQKAVLWPEQGYDSFGHKRVGSPVELSVRWNNTRRETLDAQSHRITLDALVIVDRKIGIGGIMWLGELADWYGTGSGSAGEGDELFQVESDFTVMDIKGRVFRREYGLKRYRDTLPVSS